MDGQPVWLASISKTGLLSGDLIATGSWVPFARSSAERLLRDVLRGVGDPGRERLFRMNVTLCMHRALTDAEVGGLPASFHAAPPMDLAGGPVEVLWENVPGAESTRPCHDPIRGQLEPRSYDPSLWIPLDCGACPPCRARAAVMAEREREPVLRYVDEVRPARDLSWDALRERLGEGRTT